MCSGTGVQMVSCSVQRTATPSSSSASSTNPQVRREASEEIHIKQMFGSDEKSVGEHLSSVYLFYFFKNIVKNTDHNYHQLTKSLLIKQELRDGV